MGDYIGGPYSLVNPHFTALEGERGRNLPGFLSGGRVGLGWVLWLIEFHVDVFLGSWAVRV